MHLPENVGLGRARNAGLGHARGDYVLFLDSDDSYTPGLLEALAARLDAAGDLDTLVFDHVRTYWWGTGGRSQTAGLSEKAGTDVFRQRRRGAITERVVRRLFLGQKAAPATVPLAQRTPGGPRPTGIRGGSGRAACSRSRGRPCRWPPGAGCPRAEYFP